MMMEFQRSGRNDLSLLWVLYDDRGVFSVRVVLQADDLPRGLSLSGLSQMDESGRMKILNLFAGIGGNRTLWGDKHEITAIDDNLNSLKIYSKRFSSDITIFGDAYEFLERRMDEFDFIWASPPCQSHSRLNTTCQNMRIPDMRLYGIITFLSRFCKGKWVVENVIPYYPPLIKPTAQLGRHLFWSNFNIPEKKFPQPKGTVKDLPIKELMEWHNIKTKVNRKMLRNCVDYRVGKYILNCAIKPKQKLLTSYNL